MVGVKCTQCERLEGPEKELLAASMLGFQGFFLGFHGALGLLGFGGFRAFTGM